MYDLAKLESLCEEKVPQNYNGFRSLIDNNKLVPERPIDTCEGFTKK